MCDIAPFQMECINDDCKSELICCSVAHLSCAVHELLASLPAVRMLDFGEYQCKQFLPKQAEQEDEYE